MPVLGPDLWNVFDVSCTASEPPGVDLRSVWKSNAADFAGCTGARSAPGDSSVDEVAVERVCLDRE